MYIYIYIYVFISNTSKTHIYNVYVYTMYIRHTCTYIYVSDKISTNLYTYGAQFRLTDRQNPSMHISLNQNKIIPPMYIYIHARIKRALRARTGLWKNIMETYYGGHIMADILQ